MIEQRSGRGKPAAGLVVSALATALAACTPNATWSPPPEPAAGMALPPAAHRSANDGSSAEPPGTAAHEAKQASARRFGVVFYGTSLGTSPNSIIRLDNNAEILAACTDGKTAAQLEELGVSFTESQLVLLRHYRLLERTGGVHKTAFTVLDPASTARLRTLMREKAAETAPQLRGDVAALKSALATDGREGSSYTILFSYVLDGMVWDRFADRGLKTQMAAEQPLWDGVLWMLSPPRPFRSGTNSITKGQSTFKLHWSDAAREQLMPLLGNWGMCRRMAVEILTSGRVASRNLRDTYRAFGIFDAQGRSLLPVIHERAENPLFAASSRLADQTAQAFLDSVDLDRLMREFDLPDKRTAVVIGYHEWMWELIDELERTSLVRRPLLFSHPSEAPKARVGELMFLVQSAAAPK